MASVDQDTIMREKRRTRALEALKKREAQAEMTVTEDDIYKVNLPYPRTQ